MTAAVGPSSDRRSTHFGIITPPVSGHLHPFGALGRELISRGHRVTVLHMADLAQRVSREDLEFIAIGSSDHPKGSLEESLAALAKLQGLPALRFTIDAVRKTSEMMCREAPAAIQQAGIEVLLVDQTEPAGGTIAEHLQLPFITICNALILTRERNVPPPFTPWTYHPSAFTRIRNWAGYRISQQVLRPVTNLVSLYRRQWKLPAHRTAEDSYSPLLQISQQPSAFDFPRDQLPSHFHYVGPLRRASARTATSFPWDKLNGKPLIYASLGTLQNRKEFMFRCFAQACAGLDAQLVMTHGGGLSDSDLSAFPGNPVIVPYAPQGELLQRAALTLTHAGLNTVLDSLSCGVPLVAVPITYEQPAIASRIVWAGVGDVLELKRLNVDVLKKKLISGLNNVGFRENAARLQASISEAGGVERAASLIENTLLIP